MKKGVITIATKHPLYGRYAYNLAVSVRAIAPEIPITVIADSIGLSHLDDMQLTVFDRIITPDAEDYNMHGKCVPLVLKYHLHKYSPYECTMFCDADTIFSPMANLHHAFSQLSGNLFTIANRGECDPAKGQSEWVNEGIIDCPYWYDLSSEFIYFEKSDIAKAVFDGALKHYKEGALQTKMFAGDKPDEPFLMLGMIEQGIKPHRSPFKPAWWYWQEKRHINAMDFKRQYLLLSMGGKMMTNNEKNIYNEILKNIAYTTGYRTMTVNHKWKELPERQHI